MPRFVLALLAGMALVTQVALGDIRPEQVLPVYGAGSNCSQVTMCDAETDVGACKNAGGTEVISTALFSRSNLTFYADQGVGAYDCDIYTSSRNYDDSSGTGVQINSPAESLVSATQVLSYEGLFGHLWLECTATGTQATVIMLVCPVSQ